MKKIMFFIGTLGAGGAERVISILTHHLVDKGYPVEIVLYYDSAPFYDIHPDIKITYVEKETGSKNILKNVLWLRKYFKKHADLVISFLAQFNMLALAALIFTGIPAVVADRNDPRHMPKQKVLRVIRNILYRLADVVVVQTQHNKVYFSEAVQKKSTIIPNPVNLGEKRGMALTAAKKKRIVSVARLMPQKNQLMLLDVFAKVKENFPDYTLTIYGEGPFRDKLQERIAELQLGDCIELPGKVKNVFDYIADAELFVLSSDYEGMPNALIEAMCLGLPVISTKVSGATDLILDGKNGLLTDVGDTQMLAKQMSRMLEDAELREKCAAEAIKINDALDTDKVVEQWLSCIEGIR